VLIPRSLGEGGSNFLLGILTCGVLTRDNGATNLHLNFHVYASGQVQRRECINGLGVGVHDVYDALMNAHFKLLARVLVNERGAVHGPLFLFGGQRNRSDHLYACPFRRLNDRAGGLVNDLMIIRADFNPHAVRRFFSRFG